MRVMMLTDYFPPYAGGGVERVVFELARTLVQQGLDVGIVTLSAHGRPSEERLDGIPVWRVRGYTLTRLLGLQSAFSPGIFRDALRICGTFAPDVIHAHNIFFTTSLAGPMLKWKLRRPLVTTMHLGRLDHLPGIPGTVARLYEALAGRWILKHSDAVLAVSDSVRTHGLELGVHPRRIRTVLNAVDVSAPARASPQSPSPQRVIFVGRLVANKGPHLFVRAAMRVLASARDASAEDVEFLLIGEGPMRWPLESEVQAHGCASRIRFLGFRDDVSALLQGATLFVRPSLLEGYPLAVLEAMTCGVPVIASRVPGNTDLIQHGETGVLTDVGNVGSLGDAIATLLGDAGTRRRLAGNARKAMGRHPGWPRIARELIEVYEGL